MEVEDKYVDDGVHWLILTPDNKYLGGYVGVPTSNPMFEFDPKIEIIHSAWEPLIKQLEVP